MSSPASSRGVCGVRCPRAHHQLGHTNWRGLIHHTETLTCPNQEPSSFFFAKLCVAPGTRFMLWLPIGLYRYPLQNKSLGVWTDELSPHKKVFSLKNQHKTNEKSTVWRCIFLLNMRIFQCHVSFSRGVFSNVNPTKIYPQPKNKHPEHFGPFILGPR